jgi:hypothetical protein
MNAGERKGVHWGSVALGWLVAAVAGATIRPLLGALYGSLAALPTEPGASNATAVVLALVSGFLAYLLGGFTAGRSSGHSGALNGAMTAVLGLVLGLAASAVLAPFDAVFAWGVAAPPANFGLGGEAVVAGLLLFLSDLFGGYVGGELGEPGRPKLRRIN